MKEAVASLGRERNLRAADDRWLSQTRLLFITDQRSQMQKPELMRKPRKCTGTWKPGFFFFLLFLFFFWGGGWAVSACG